MQKFGRYTVLREIASGSTATVYLAEDGILRRQVALKALHPHLHSHAEFVKRFEKEAVAIAALSHENVIKVFEFGREGRSLYLAMEYVAGETLESLLKASPEGIPCLAAAAAFRQLLEGLHAAHARGIYHRDIKPSNVLVGGGGRVRIADFGVAYLSEDTSITRTGSFLGTPGYSAPEQIEGGTVTDRTDIFATGILFHRCLSGRLPFPGETPHAMLVAIMGKSPEPLPAHTRKLLPGTRELIEAMLEKDPARRPDAAACLESLEAAVRGPGFAFDPRRLDDYRRDPQGYRKQEDGLLAFRFLELAREAKRKADMRLALKLYASAEAFLPGDALIRRESETLLRQARLRTRGKSAALVLAISILLAVLAVGVGLRLPVAAPASRVAVARAPARKMPEPAPAPHPARHTTPPSAAGDPPPAPAAMARTAGGESVRFPPQPYHSGYLSVKTNPPFASLFVDGADAGASPTREPMPMPPGRHGLAVERRGCRPLQTEFRIAPGETLSLRLVLEKEVR